LPVLRVFLMLVVFVRERDFRFSAIAMLVLAIMLLGSVLSASTPRTSRNCVPSISNKHEDQCGPPVAAYLRIRARATQPAPRTANCF
jgi:hypothetical protein